MDNLHSLLAVFTVSTEINGHLFNINTLHYLLYKFINKIWKYENMLLLTAVLGVLKYRRLQYSVYLKVKI